MKLHNWVVLGLLFMMMACSKENITTKPQLRLKKISTDYVPLGVGLNFEFEFSDKEGDISLPVGIKKISLECDDASYLDTLSFVFPDIPGTKNTNGILEIKLDAMGDLARLPCHGNDTLEQAIFKFWLRDDAGNVSDTVTTPEIFIEK